MVDVAAPDRAGDRTSAGAPVGRSLRSWLRQRVNARRVSWAIVDLLVPTFVFLGRVGPWMLNARNAPQMMTNDWVTYIVAPNYLRSAPVLSLPIGRVPDYIAPVGSSLGLSDAVPVLTPI